MTSDIKKHKNVKVNGKTLSKTFIENNDKMPRKRILPNGLQFNLKESIGIYYEGAMICHNGDHLVAYTVRAVLNL